MLALAGGSVAAATPGPEAVPAELGLAELRAATSSPIEAVIVELEGRPGFALPRAATGAPGAAAAATRRARLADHARSLFATQDAFLAEVERAGLLAIPRIRETHRADGTIERVHYRFHYLMNGLVVWVAASDRARLAGLPGVVALHEPMRPRFFLDHSVDHVLGSHPTIAARRAAVYGAAEELAPLDSSGGSHPEETDWTHVDGLEGQGTYLSVIDSGLDYQHPSFGGTGLATATPQQGGGAGTEIDPVNDNRKVVYFYNLGGAATLDDFGHGTHVASTAAGYLVDASTPDNGLGVAGPPNGAAFHGVAPQTKLLGYPVCNASSQCPGDIELGIEDSVSPVSLAGASGSAIPTALEKPVADVINLSLGDGSGNPAGSTSRFANNAVLAGALIAAAAGNDGPGAGTVGAPCAATLVTCVAAAEDPGSVAGADLLQSGQTAPDPCAGQGACATPGPPAETGAASESNAGAGILQGLKLFAMAGGGPIPEGSVSAHYTLVDRDQPNVPTSVGNRVALLRNGSGTFFQIVNPVAASLPPPAAILLSSTVTSATAVAVVQDVPVFTVHPDDATALIAAMEVPGGAVHGSVSSRPARVQASVDLASFDGDMGSFSSRGPNDHADARFRTLKPDLAAPGVGVLAATTPSGNPDDGIGMGNPSGYTVASGTSMATPHVAGAMLLVRQHLRGLGYDSTDLGDPEYREKRFEAQVLTRALLVNTATNLRTGTGIPDGDGAASVASLDDMGAGLLDVAAALDADAVLTGEVILHDAAPDEYTPSGDVGPGDLAVPLPSHSFGLRPVVGVASPVRSSHVLTLRDVTGQGHGDYTLAFQDNRNAAPPAVEISFSDGGGDEIGVLSVPVNGEASFSVDVDVRGDLLAGDPTEIQFFVTATHQATLKTLRVPMIYRAVAPDLGEVAAPIAESLGPADPAGQPACPLATTGTGTFQWSYVTPEGGATPVGFRVELGTTREVLFFDDASEPLVAGANSTFAGSEQWTSAVNPDTGGLAYYVPDSAMQNEALALIDGVAIPLGSGTLRFVTRQDTESGFDFTHVDVNVDGGPYSTVGSSSGAFSGERSYSISAFTGGDVRVRFRMTSDDVVSAPGWWVEDVEIVSDDFGLLADTGPGAVQITHDVAEPGRYLLRVAGLFPSELGAAIGPTSGTLCLETPLFRDGFESGDTSAWSR